jgi:hypothetical protein
MSFLDSVFGRKPDVPALQPTDPLAELSTLLGGEIKDWPQIEQISNLYQQYMLGALDQAIPGFGDILKQGGIDTQDILSQADPLIKGELPQDVKDATMRNSAFQSLMGGTAGSPMAGALTARDLGLTSLQLQQQGTQMAEAGSNAAQRWASLAGGTILSPSANMYSPAWFSDFMAKQRASQQAIAQQRANVAAAPDPALQALNQWVEQVGGSIVSSYAGGGMGGGGMGGRGGGFATSYNAGSYLGGATADPMSDVNNPGYYSGGANPGTITPYNPYAYNPYMSPFNATMG